MLTYQALLHRFQVVCEDAKVDAYLRAVLAPLEIADDAGREATEYRLAHSVGAEELDELWIGDARTRATRRGPGPIESLLLRIDRDAEEVTGRQHTVLHAAACHLDGRVLLVPGPPDAGKSTLVAYLTSQGWTYVSDELLAVLPGTPPQVLSYPRTVVLDPGSWPLFDGYLIEPHQALVAQLPQRRHLAPPVHSRAQPGVCVPVSDVLLYHWNPGTRAHIDDLDPVDALRALLGSSFSLHSRPGRDLQRLSDVIEHCACWHAVGADLAELEEALRATLGLSRTDVRRT